jgi:hypothetical protein
MLAERNVFFTLFNHYSSITLKVIITIIKIIENKIEKRKLIRKKKKHSKQTNICLQLERARICICFLWPYEVYK